MKRTYHILPAMLLLLTLSSCQGEEEPWAGSDGHIVLGMPVAGPFVATDTRTVHELTDLSGFVFMLSGTDNQGQPIDQAIEFHKDGDAYTAIAPAGTYTLTADNEDMATTGTGAPYYRGTSASFSLSPGGHASVSINLGAPQNAELVLALDASFSSLYDLQEVAFDDGSGRSNILTTNGTSYVMIPADGIVTYTIKATAKAGSHVSDLPATGINGRLAVANGHSTTLNLTAKTIADLIIEMGDGTFDGEFESRR